MRNNYLTSVFKSIGTTFIFIIVLLSNMSVKAQGNLQFNQVINQNINTGSGGTCYTVPAGKVFKLEGVTTYGLNGGVIYVGTSCGSFNLGAVNFLTGGTNVGSHTSFTSYAWPFPLWFKAGTSLVWGSADGSVPTINGIEFNIVP